MIYVTGDTHGPEGQKGWIRRFAMANFPEQKELTKDDYVVVCGDFGIWDGSKEEKHGLDWLEAKPWTTLFVDGNHENYDMLDSMSVEEWHGGKVNFLRPSVIHLMRGQVFDIDGKRFFSFGGAESHDIKDGILERSDPAFKKRRAYLNKLPFAQYRINHETWWAREMPSEAEMEEGFRNLEKVGNEVDYVVTHAAPSSTNAYLGYSDNNALNRYLERIKNTVEYEHWYCGHLHINKDVPFDRISVLYENIEKLRDMESDMSIWENVPAEDGVQYGRTGKVDVVEMLKALREGKKNRKNKNTAEREKCERDASEEGEKTCR